MLNKYFNLAKNELFRINRSITGNGTRQTLKIIKKELPQLSIKYFISGSKVFDWKIAAVWNVSAAFIKDKFGKKIIDIKENNLHLQSYSTPINIKIKKKKLLSKLYYLNSQPKAIPYVTSYYKKNWAFCLNKIQFNNLKKNYKDDDTFNVCIESEFNNNGKMYYGEYFIKGETSEEILISTYICHSSMANDNLSGIIVTMNLINFFQKKKKLKKSIRFIFIPETIGSIAYISKNLKNLKKNVIGGYNLTCIGDNQSHSCLLSKYKKSASDLSLLKAYKDLKIKSYKIYPFKERGSDERQFNSPGIDIPLTSIFRTKYNEYKEYHTSLDNFDLVNIKGIRGGYNVTKTAILNLLKIIIPKPKVLCEPQLGRRGLYPRVSIKSNKNADLKRFSNFLQYADGKNTIEQICEFLNLKINETEKIYKILKKHKLVI